MKKLLALLLVLAMIFSLATVFTACDDSGYSAEDDDDDDDDDDDGNEKDPVVTPLTDEDAAKAALKLAVDVTYGNASNISNIAPDVIWNAFATRYETTKEAMISKYPEYAAAMEAEGNTFTYTVDSVTAGTTDVLDLVRDQMMANYSWEIPADAKSYILSYTYTGTHEGETDTDTQQVLAVKVDGAWYVFTYEIGEDYAYSFFACDHILMYLARLANPDASDTPGIPETPNEPVDGVFDPLNAEHTASEGALVRYLDMRYYGVIEDLNLLGPREFWNYISNEFYYGTGDLIPYIGEYEELAYEDRDSYTGSGTNVSYTINSILPCQSNIYSAIKADIAYRYDWYISDSCTAYYMDVTVTFSNPMYDLSTDESYEYVALEYNGVWYLFEYYSYDDMTYIDYPAYGIVEDLIWLAEGRPTFD